MYLLMAHCLGAFTDLLLLALLKLAWEHRRDEALAERVRANKITAGARRLSRCGLSPGAPASLELLIG